MIKPITPCLWFDDKAEEAANYYCSFIENSSIVAIERLSDEANDDAPSRAFVEFLLNGQPFQALDGGPLYQFTPAISMSVLCADQQEVDYYWDNLVAGGKEIQCGWLVDKYGVSWQIVPEAFMRLIKDSDREKAKKVMDAMLQMIKLDVAGLEAAYNS